ncbi:abscisic acid 8'-hydroxylase 4 isoform X2 [Diospyros lotus]|uniref:abscisic acid 8'-hydroxylase 4 isoform X2 n=1 Tax=Diospyros lotus TaxID=55363 RepID=UPI00224CFB42|nr:abscisic acid 8'-hydroxylase 4 isoform X2 [Diospyros lotus]
MAMLLPSLLLVLFPPPDASATLNFCCYIALSAALSWLLFRVAKIAWPGPSESRASVPPGNRGLPLIGETLQFMAALNGSKGFYDFVRVRSLRHGNCFKTSIFGETHVFVSSTESAKAILNNDSGRFTKRYIRSIAEIVGEESLLCASQQQHRLIRGRLASLFSTSSLGHFIKQFDGLIVSALDSWEHKGTVIVLQEALRITFKAMCKMLISLEGEEEDMLEEDVGLVCEAMLAFPLRLPWTRFGKGLQARARIMGRLEKTINERRGLKEAHYEDFLQHLLMEDGKDYSDGGEAPPMSDAQIKDNILTMIIAGQDTTASAITWMVKYLDDNQEVLHTLKAEQLSLAERSSSKTFLALEDLNDMPYASKVIKESLRMASIVPWFPRSALEDTEIHGYKIKKGWNINIDARSIHLDPTVYNDPNKFIPSRFDDESKPYSFLAFGQGGRTCLGMNLARAMMLVFLHRLVTTYKWQVIDQDLSVEKWALFSRLKSGCPITVNRIKED